MSLPAEATVLRWASTFAFIGFFAAALYMVGATLAPWIGAGVTGALAVSLWLRHIEESGNARVRAEGQEQHGFRAEVDGAPQGARIIHPRNQHSPPRESQSTSYYDDEDD
ncbi:MULTISPECIES: hypothetical protein [Pseudonocardia]|uniref:Uncharacterized protein n=2 Tax=Pseudonocardia TaxID=1847 RepID=A0A1Y2N758_PSEAH|nr:MULTISPECIES: hypothetical protein [Pseudonocardia]OSY42927.1 hypothetical protein BG845_01169 [Pseudonocardia autotrophica]TDN77503.1 hypothetical protein C8E95_6751 [Pseudonocardia autotrophica]BBG01528.1 hypothetical protein Pdca_27370 [Pseudonocardia autotrophica]GEC25312.1 hypothetical protein PSA01_23410 [Pseudonocardia saturnea]